MRVTNKMLSNNYLSDMNTNLQNLQKIQQQMSTGKNFSKPSDDPFNVARSMQMNTGINANTQYNKNITNVINWMDTTDTALGQVGNVFQSVREKLVSAGNAAYGSDERQKIKDEINQRVGQVGQILNTNFDGEYIFGGTQGASKPVNTSVDANGNTKLTLSDKAGNSLDLLSPVVSQTVNPANWSGKTITFEVTPSGSSTAVSSTITLDTLPTNPAATIDDVVNNLNSKINSYSTGTPATFPLKGEISINKTSDGKIKFESLTSDAVKITGADATVVSDLGTAVGNQLPSYQIGNIANQKKTEISQGVVVDYNVSATDIMNFNNGDNISKLLTRIVNHLDGKNDDGTSSDSTATSKLTNEDLADLDKATAQLLKIRSQVGAKQNRMESAKEQNEQSKLDMTDILSKTEDIDITQKTMEFATMQTVYLASLQTSAKVIQPTLMDYLR